MTTGQKIAACRREKGLTQAELAKRLGVTRQAVSRWESDAAFPETDTLIALGRLFGVSLDWLLRYDGEERAADTGDARQEEGQAESSLHKFASDIGSFHIEYKSKACIGGLPLVHVNIGLGRTAKGVISVGLASVGIVSVGLLSLGVLSVGLVSFGFFAVACVGAGIFCVGGVALGCIVLGGVAVGLFAFGGVAAGLFSFGGYAAGYYIAVGGVARGGIALGLQHAGGWTLAVEGGDLESMRESVYQALDGVPQFWSLFTAWCRGLYDVVASLAKPG